MLVVLMLVVVVTLWGGERWEASPTAISTLGILLLVESTWGLWLPNTVVLLGL